MISEHGATERAGGHRSQDADQELTDLEIVVELDLLGLVGFRLGGEAELVLAVPVDEVERSYGGHEGQDERGPQRSTQAKGKI